MSPTAASSGSPVPSDRPRLLLIDGHSIAYRAFFALPVENFSTSTGQHTNAVYGFTSMLINVLRDERPTHVCVAFDVSRQTFRTEVYTEYKANRSASPDEFRGQVALVKDVLDALNVAHCELDGYEADDIIGTLSTRAGAAGFEVLICTGDRDAFQLVTGDVTVLYPRKGVSDLARMTPPAIEEKYFVAPARYPELAALVGETSDNLPGIPGVGPKTAAKWLSAYDGLENLVRRNAEVPGKAGEAFREHLADVLRNREVNALVCNLELPVTLADLERQPWNREAVHELFDALEFRVLRERLLETLPQEEESTQGGFELAGDVLAPGQVRGWLAQHGHGRLTGLDFLGHWGAGAGDITALSLATADGAAAHLASHQLSPDDDAALAEWLADPEVPKALHEAKGPTLAAWSRGWQIGGVTCDTLLAAYLLRPDQRTFDLADLAVRHLKRELRVEGADEGSTGDQLALDFGAHEPDAGAAQASMVRARAVIDLADALMADLEAQGGRHLMAEVELPLLGTLARMERAGIAVDADRLDSLRSDFDATVVRAEQSAYHVLGRQINLGSPKQLQQVLFDEFQMPKTRRTKSGYTTDAEALEGLYAKTEHPFLQHLLAHRDAIRLRQTVDGLIKSIADDGRIHTTYVQTVAATGRLSSTDPNLQNIPIRTDAGRRIREAFVVGRGYETLLTADYSQIEMRVMAHLSQDALVIEALRSGADFHTTTAAKVFGVRPDEITHAQRAKVKQMNFGLAYGLSAFGLSNQLGIPVSEARGLMDDYFERFGGIRDYLNSIVAVARKTGYTETILGRRRYLPDLNSPNRQRREMAERMALNAPIQGSAADIIKVAMLDVESALRAEGLRSRMLLQVHDELVLEVADGETDRVVALVRERMGHAVELSVPLDVSVGLGRSWHDAAH